MRQGMGLAQRCQGCESEQADHRYRESRVEWLGEVRDHRQIRQLSPLDEKVESVNAGDNVLSVVLQPEMFVPDRDTYK